MAAIFLILSPLFWSLDIIALREAVLGGYSPIAYSLLRYILSTLLCLLPALQSGTLFSRDSMRRGCLMGSIFGSTTWLVGWCFSSTLGSHCGLITPLSLLCLYLWRAKGHRVAMPMLPMYLVVGGSIINSWSGSWQPGDAALPVLAVMAAAHTMLVEHKGSEESPAVLIFWQSACAGLICLAIQLCGSAPLAVVPLQAPLSIKLLPVAAALLVMLATAVEIKWQRFVGAGAATVIYSLDTPIVAAIYLMMGESLRVADYFGLALVMGGGILAAFHLSMAEPEAQGSR